jgi:plasmid stability protein
METESADLPTVLAHARRMEREYRDAVTAGQLDQIERIEKAFAARSGDTTQR